MQEELEIVPKKISRVTGSGNCITNEGRLGVEGDIWKDGKTSAKWA